MPRKKKLGINDSGDHQCRKLRVLRLGDHNLKCGANSIVRALSHNGNIEELDLSCCNLRLTQEMCEDLQRCPKLILLNLSGNKAMQLVALAEILPNFPTLLTLNLREIAVSERAWSALVSALQKCKHLCVQFDGLKLSAAILAGQKGKCDVTDIQNVINDGKIAIVWQACHHNHYLW